jgi:penicillin-binding protein 1C
MSRSATALAPRRAAWATALRRTALALAALAGLSIVGVLAFAAALGPTPLGRNVDYSALVLDRDGRLLRPFATADGYWRFPAKVDDVDPRYLNLLFAYEDKRFRAHHGVDMLAMLRAAGQWISHGRVVSGGSTLTMQVARLLEPRAERTLSAKARQLVRAVELEYHLSKDQILALYLSLAPYGGNIEGVRAASFAYLGKEPRRLTLGEAALLVALPQSPEARRPDRSPDIARRARDRVLDRVATAGLLPQSDVEHAKAEPVPDARQPMPMLAPHLAEQLVARKPGQTVYSSTVDGVWQKSLEELVRERARQFGPEVSIAILAVDNATGEILAKIASADYFDDRRAGRVDMTQALRSPGSTLKPFIYGVGFEDGVIHPETEIEDRPVRYGNYAPENFDLSFQGITSVRRALQMSLNVPAVAVLDKVGAQRLSSRLSQAGGTLVFPKGEVPGLAMGLGGVGARLADLVKLYAGLARLGTTVDLTDEASSREIVTHRLLEPIAAWYVGNVLLGTPPPENAVAGRIAFKTGTSYGYRDAWSVGFDGKRTIGVWVGRPDGAPVPGLVGRTAAAPILFDAFSRLGKSLAPLPHAPKGTLFASNAKLPLPLRRFRRDGLPSESGERRPHILYPPDGARLDLTGGEAAGMEPVLLKVSGGVQPLTLLVNGAAVPGLNRRKLSFVPDGPGFVRVTVMDANGAVDSVLLRVQ